MQTIQQTTRFLDYSASIIKNAAIGVVVGYLDLNAISRNCIAPFCESNTSEISQYLCLQSAKFFDPQNFSRIMRRPVYLINSIQEVVKLPISVVARVIPRAISLQASNCDLLFDFSIIKNMNFSDKMARSNLTLKCCNPDLDSTILSMAFTEELIFRVGIQNILLNSIASLCPKRVGKIISHPVSRILTTSLLFALAHQKEFLLPEFMSGIACGILDERYGLVAAIASHATHNFCVIFPHKKSCENLINQFSKNT